MFYKFIRVIARGVVFLLNGNWHVTGKENLPEGTYIIVAPHRNWWEPIFFALAMSPQETSFMAKQELFKYPVLRYILIHAHAFPVDRANPGPSAVKKPINFLKKENLSLIMFPSGTRHSDDLKGGAVLIAKLSQKPLVPMVYQGPDTFKGLLKRQKITIGIGEPFSVDKKEKMNDELTAKIDQQMKDSWQAIDNSIDPSYKYIPK
ncbi:1-acyl-sn-glycerol-3-phosphate acyltransferase [Lactobacillus sp. YT155]|uniref:lysophospholipid acyltransferase family protein n=1 Tax=Lactobacillus sp. YT155 TaxID=3060955 RepID=UPI00265EB9DB|nr:1-acyl-sn-glycerol-3-phosphate acyltransferase [Lactobacillus sp. YT155]MDO1605523.1 1-acyl-sn-glycerol-3-phosphate acyltransferase [Lactobacillus sp. YT155]